MTAPTGTVYRAALLVACWATAFGGLAGCSEEPGRAGTLPSRTASPTPTTTSASPTPTTVEEQVEAAVRAYYAELTRAAQTQETAEFRRHVASGCSCARVADSIERVRKAGKSTPDVAWTVEEIVIKEMRDETAVAEVRYRVAPYEVLDAKGRVLKRYEAQRGHVDLSMVKGSRGWIVGNLFDLEG